jgi:hypothetical protein
MRQSGSRMLGLDLGTVVRVLGTAGLVLTTVACRTECLADEAATRDQLAREQKAVLRGQGTCKELVTPKLSLVADRLTVTSTKEHVLGLRRELPTTELRRFDPLHERLKSYRDHFKIVRAAEPFQPMVYIDLDPALEPVRAATVLATAAFAGYPRFRIYTNDLVLDVDWWTSPTPDDRRAIAALCIEPRPEGRLQLRFDGSGAEGRHRRVATSLDALGAEIAAVCEGRSPCADLIAFLEPDGATFIDVAHLIQAAFGASPFAERKPPVVLVTRAPVGGLWATEPPTRAAWRGSLRPCAGPDASLGNPYNATPLRSP